MAAGTFAGTLQSVDGIFTGTLQGVDGDFSGTLQSVDGTFTGLLQVGGSAGGGIEFLDGSINFADLSPRGTVNGTEMRAISFDMGSEGEVMIVHGELPSAGIPVGVEINGDLNVSADVSCDDINCDDIDAHLVDCTGLEVTGNIIMDGKLFLVGPAGSGPGGVGRALYVS